jgi:cytochrome d ubiquinol oxidase subunit II
MLLNLIWYVLIIVLFCGYVVLDGFDLGVGMNYFMAETQKQKRVMLNSIGPLWDGNEVWLITAGGALFAAFPNVYATVFSGFYTAFTLFLVFLIGRGIAIEFRGKIENVRWQNIWDWIFMISSYAVVFLLGVALGNIVTGIPLKDYNGVKEFSGNLFTLLHAYPIFLGVTAVFAIRMHGLIFTAMKSEEDLQYRTVRKIIPSLFVFEIFYFMTGIWTWIRYPEATANFLLHPVFFIVPLVAVAGIHLIPTLLNREQYFGAFLCSSAILVSSILMVGIGNFPNLVYAINNPENSLSIFVDTSSQKTLMTMLIIACIGVPIVLGYQFFVYRIFRGKVKIDDTSY